MTEIAITKALAAYKHEDGTDMIEIAPHQTVNRCALDDRPHRWDTIMRGRGVTVCAWCGQTR